MHPIKEICRILTLMKRLLILIFAFNALFITPVSATDVCEMMESATTIEMSSNDMLGMDCSQCEEASCGLQQCGINSSAVTTPVLFSQKQTLFIVAGHHQPQAGFAYFYKITYPVNTPPPLV